jgi:hypothetical protein
MGNVKSQAGKSTAGFDQSIKQGTSIKNGYDA